MWSKSGGAPCTNTTLRLYLGYCQARPVAQQSAVGAGSCSCRESSKNSRRNACRFRLAPFDVSLKATNEEHVSTMSANAASLSASFRAADTATSAFSWGRYALQRPRHRWRRRAGKHAVLLPRAAPPVRPRLHPPANPRRRHFHRCARPYRRAAVRRPGATSPAPTPVTIFTVISAIVFVVTLIPDFTYIATVPGESQRPDRRSGPDARHCRRRDHARAYQRCW